jgi:CubicO group peptidase (beta-lactamase class C family)
MFAVSAEPIDLDVTYDQSIKEWMDRYDIPGVGVSLIIDGQIAYAKTHGYADKEQAVLLTNESILRTESISKSVTAYLTMVLVSEGLIDLHTPINQYIDIDVSDDITTHLLLTHQAGLDIGPFSEHYRPDESKPDLRQHLVDTIDFKYPPKANFNYSNVGYNLIQYVIESVTGDSFEQNVRNYIFDPFGISDASFVYDPSKESLYAMGYDINGHRVEPYVYPDQAAGGLFTDLDAITRFFQQIYTNEEVLSLSESNRLYDVYTPTKGEYQLVSDGYGYGHFIENNASKAVFHGGQGHGWMAFYYGFPEDGNAIIIITNSQRSYPMISALINQFNEQMNYEKAGMSVIVNALVYLRIALVLMATILLFIPIKMFKNTLKIERFKRMGLIIKTMFLIGLLILVLYLWLTPYMFVQVLYPILYSQSRMIISLFFFGYLLVLFHRIYWCYRRYKLDKNKDSSLIQR